MVVKRERVGLMLQECGWDWGTLLPRLQDTDLDSGGVGGFHKKFRMWYCRKERRGSWDYVG